MTEAMVRVQIESIRHYDHDSGFGVIKGRDCNTNKLLTLNGTFPVIREGEMYEVEGKWVDHPTYGPQFKVFAAKHHFPTTRSAIKKFLTGVLFKDIRGLGDKTAENVVKTHGLNTLDIIESAPEKLLEVKGISKKSLSHIEEAWAKHYHHASSTIFLTDLGLSAPQVRKVISTYGRGVEKTVSDDPYRLGMEIKGIGFRTCDQIATKVGIAPNSTTRIRGAIVYILQQAEEQGHCYLSNPLLFERLLDLLKVKMDDLTESIHEIIQNLNDEFFIVTEQKESESGELESFHYSGQLYHAEKSVSSRVKTILNGGFLSFDPSTKEKQKRIDLWLKNYKEKGGTLSEEQENAVKICVTSKMFILTGGPGVGKTTTANTIIGLFKAMGRSISIAAPTGRAAQRLSEVSGETAKTIHRLLEWNPAEAGFKRNLENPLVSDVVVVDEASMLDIRLADSLLQAIKDEAQLVFIGDVDQLPSVGPGNVLRDMIYSDEIAFLKLEKIFRQAGESQIIQAAHQINKGSRPEFENASKSDCQFLEAKDSETALNILRDLIDRQLPAAGYDPLKDIQILSPMNKGGLGAIALNEMIQKLIHQSKVDDNLKKKKNPYIVGDKVIQTSNNYELGVFNGDIGYVEFKNTSEGALSVRFSHKLVHYSKEQVSELKLAYCITIHKSQGSEFPVVIIPISTSHYVMLQRNLVYTALTRGKRLAIFIGSHIALSQAIKNQASHERLTRLTGRIKGEC